MPNDKRRAEIAVIKAADEAHADCAEDGCRICTALIELELWGGLP